MTEEQVAEGTTKVYFSVIDFQVQADQARKAIAEKDQYASGMSAVLRAVASGYSSDPVMLAREYLRAIGVEYLEWVSDSKVTP